MTIAHRMPIVLGTYVPEPRRVARVAGRGYRVERKPRTPVLLDDSQVLLARWLFEFGGWTFAMVRDHFGLKPGYVRTLMDYQTRGKIIPKRDDFEQGCVAYAPKDAAQ